MLGLDLGIGLGSGKGNKDFKKSIDSYWPVNTVPCFYVILQKGISPVFRFALSIPGFAPLFLSYNRSFPLLFPELTFSFFTFVSPLCFAFPNIEWLLQKYLQYTYFHSSFNVNPSYDLLNVGFFFLNFATSYQENNSKQFHKVFCLYKHLLLKQKKIKGNLLISCSFSFFFCAICLFNLFTSAWKDSTTRSLFSTSIHTA